MIHQFSAHTPKEQKNQTPAQHDPSKLLAHQTTSHYRAHTYVAHGQREKTAKTQLLQHAVSEKQKKQIQDVPLQAFSIPSSANQKLHQKLRDHQAHNSDACGNRFLYEVPLCDHKRQNPLIVFQPL